jgi:hypothetical protein
MNKKRVLWGVSFAIVVFLLVGVVFFVFLGRFAKEQIANQKVVKENTISNQKTDSASGYVVKNQAVAEPEKSSALVSENYQIEGIRFGGQTDISAGDTEGMPIQIDGVRTETFTNSQGDKSSASISWKSDKLTVSEIEYSKSGEASQKKIKESDFGFGHSLVLSNLEPGTAYVYKIISTDHWGNVKNSDSFGFYTSAKATSVFELIGQKMKEIFGWAVK